MLAALSSVSLSLFNLFATLGSAPLSTYKSARFLDLYRMHAPDAILTIVL